jgi:integrator complex subunit 11
MIEKANFYYKLFFDWENEHIQDTFLTSNLFDFKKIRPFDKTLIRANTPMVLLATPGMLHGGSSLQVFKEWCGS